MTRELVTPDRFADLFLKDVPLLDVRAEIEFEKGAFPHAVNIPILDTQERERVGTRYKRSGQEAAVLLGHELVNGAVRDTRVRRWVEFARDHPEGALYCFRGGLRSQIAQNWMAEAGISYPRVAGGYKALRQFLMTSSEYLTTETSFIVISGRTGSGKTRLLNRCPARLDLEAMAHHRGSAFGGFPDGQPAPIDFENRVTIALMKLPRFRVAVEDEGPNVGSLSIPKPLYEKMSVSPLVVVEETRECRVENILGEYVVSMRETYGPEGDAASFDAFSDYLSGSVLKIRKRLGESRAREILTDMGVALDVQRRTGDVVSHNVWIAKLLDFYYDPLYDFQIARKSDRIAFQGNVDAVLEWMTK